MNINIKRIVLTAMLLALSTVLSLIKIFQLPLGASVTLLSMLPIVMISIIYGIKWGFLSAFLYSLIQLFLCLGEVLSWGLSPLILLGCIFFDYIFAFTAIGISGIFRRKNIKGICIGIILAMCIRFICHFISGTFFFAVFCPEGWNVALYSVCYNGTFMLPEMIFTIIGAVILFKVPQINKLIVNEN